METRELQGARKKETEETKYSETYTETTTMNDESKEESKHESEKVSKENERDIHTRKAPQERHTASGEVETENDLTYIATFEDLLQLVGTRGRWNLLLFLLCAYATFVSPMQTLSYQFLGATPDHWCRVDPLLEAGWTQEQVLSFAIPFNEEGKHETCLMYEHDYTKAAELGYEWAVATLQNATALVPCYVRDFNRSQYQSTMTTEWDLVCERRVLYSTTQAAAQAGKFVGNFLLGYILDLYGRRRVVLWCSVLAVLSGFGSALSPVVEIYIFLKIVITAVMSGVYLGCFTLLMETCGSQERSKVGTMFVVPWALGYMVLPGIAYLVRPWKWLQAAISLPSLLLLLYFWFLPESPRWLILQGKQQEALEVLKRAATVNGRTLPSDQILMVVLQQLKAKAPAEQKPTAADTERADGSRCARAARWTLRVMKEYLVVLRVRDLRRRALVVFFCWFSASLVYYGISLNATNISADPYLYIFLGGVLEVPSYVLLWPAIILLGRVKTLAMLYLLCALAILILALLMFLYPDAPIGLLMLFSLSGKMAITAGFHLIWMFTLELFPTKYRSLATSQASVSARVGSVSSPYLNDLLGDIIVWAPSAVFSIASLLAAGLSLLLPETGGRSLPEGNSIAKDSSRPGQDNLAYLPETASQVNHMRKTEEGGSESENNEEKNTNV